MALSEFQLIQKYFACATPSRSDVALGIGDDAAVLDIAAGRQLVLSIDCSLADVHFPLNANADDIGYRCLAVNLSDLAAMGAEPCWITLSLTLPENNANWLAGFSRGLAQLATQYQVALVGGDTTKGPLAIAIQAHGQVAKNTYMTRAGAKPGDKIFVSGSLGDAAAGLALYQQNKEYYDESESALIQRYLRPTARVDLGLALAELASSCIDISDGLLADLGHIIKASNCGAKINVDSLPLSDSLLTQATADQQRHWALSGGDDYELCFTLSAENCCAVEQLADSLALPLQCIGEITAGQQIECYREDGSLYPIKKMGYQHF